MLPFNEYLRGLVVAFILFVFLVGLLGFEMPVIYILAISVEEVFCFDSPRAEVVRCDHSKNFRLYAHNDSEFLIMFYNRGASKKAGNRSGNETAALRTLFLLS